MMTRNGNQATAFDIAVQADRQSMAAIPEDAMLPGPDARIIGPTFADWLDSATPQHWDRTGRNHPLTWRQYHV
jgi:hypothetical protein